MKRIKYDTLIPNCVGPRLAYHGFRYDEIQSYPPQGFCSFIRSYWCTSQRVSIGPIEYDVETVEVGIAQNNDSTTEVPPALLRIQEPGLRMWLSNKYITAVLESGNRIFDVLPNQPYLPETAFPPYKENGGVAFPELTHGEKLPLWWEFHGEGELRIVLNTIVKAILTDGLDWFDQQIIDVRRYHEKLDNRRRTVDRETGVDQEMHNDFRTSEE
jgi:hypothetical protein